MGPIALVTHQATYSTPCRRPDRARLQAAQIDFLEFDRHPKSQTTPTAHSTDVANRIGHNTAETYHPAQSPEEVSPGPFAVRLFRLLFGRSKRGHPGW